MIRIRAVRATEPVGNVAGPSRASEDKTKGSKGKGKGKSKEIREGEDDEGMDEGVAMEVFTLPPLIRSDTRTVRAVRSDFARTFFG